MAAFLTWLAGIVEGAAAHPLAAVGAAFVWGLASVALSPCHLASIPLLIGFLSSRGTISASRTWALSGVFAGGVLLTVAGVGVATWAAGRILGDLGRGVTYAMAAVFILVGLYLLEAIQWQWQGPELSSQHGASGFIQAFLFGLVFGLALGPCTFAYMAPVLGVVLKSAAKAPGLSLALAGAYALAHSGLIAAAGGSTRQVQRLLDWHGRARGAGWLKKACGLLVIAAGLYLVYKA